MIEVVMLLSIGFMAGCLLVLTLIPLIHSRAVRLTARRYRSLTPASVKEMQADKDLLRAEYAMTVRRLEISLEEAKARMVESLAEIGRKSAEIHRLNAELARRTPVDALTRVRTMIKGRAA
jgi:hypothetical protein